MAKLLDLETLEELLMALGNGTVTVGQVVNRLTTEEVPPHEDQPITLPTVGPAAGIEVLGVGDLLTRIAACCNPIRGDSIIGYITRSRGVTIHKTVCPNILAETERERLVSVGWGKTQELYPVRIRVEAADRVGLLGDVTSLVSAERVNIKDCISEEADGVSIITLTVFVSGIEQLGRLFSKLELVKGVNMVERARALG